ncbi:hypothetical protein QQ056_00360 [Oscillatoria laete-virens NRMC-F 0139]|nr:hypothetical protein [Oscillatoria laete-virens]MDL5052030.1 hypothetical protein [Oscillatoria laete-virens NRMC-F 0139]
MVIIEPPQLLVNYWRSHLDFEESNSLILDCATYLDDLSESDRQVITLFPFDHLKPQKHAVNPDIHYRLLSKTTLADAGVQCPQYSTYNLHETALTEIPLPEQFPYLIKTSHGLSGEGTYIINNPSELNYCFEKSKNIAIFTYSIPLLSLNLLSTSSKIIASNSISTKPEKSPSSAQPANSLPQKATT